MLAEFQPDILDFCKYCGAVLYDCPDWESPRWEDYNCWNGCLHEAANQKEESCQKDNSYNTT